MSELQLFSDATCSQQLRDGHAIASVPGCDGIAAVSNGDAPSWCGRLANTTAEKPQSGVSKRASGKIWQPR